MIKLLTMLTATLLTTGFAQASAPVGLLGGKINPKGNLSIHLDNLPKNTAYTVTCNIENPTYTKIYPAVIKIYPDSAIVNDHQSRFGQFRLDKENNKLIITILTGRDDMDRPEISITNYDDTDPVYVKNCIADYAL